MQKERCWRSIRLECPETGAPVALLADWVRVEGRWNFCGVSCNHPRLREVGGTDCAWSCWTLEMQRQPQPLVL